MDQENQTAVFGGNKSIVTSEMYSKMQEDLSELQKHLALVRQEEEDARRDGDLSENEKFRAATEEKDRVLGRIAQLKEQLSNVVVDDAATDNGIIQILSMVTIEDVNGAVFKGKKTFQLVANGLAEFPKSVSVGSELGAALLGLPVGETATYLDKTGVRQLMRVVDIS